VENGAPLAIRHPPDGGAVVDAGNIAAAKEPSSFAWQVTMAVFASGMTTFMSLRANDFVSDLLVVSGPDRVRAYY